jgi:hypothetical protein
MSQLNALLKQIEEYSRIWSDWQSRSKTVSTVLGNNDDHVARCQATDQLKLLFDDLNRKGRDLVDKMSVKIFQIDPVSGEKRYGQQSQDKFQSAAAQFDQLVIDITSKLAELERECAFERNMLLKIEEMKVVENNRLIESQKEQQRKQQQQLDEVTNQRQVEEETLKRKAEEEARAVREKAEMIRQKRLDDLALLKAFQYEVATLLTIPLLLAHLTQFMCTPDDFDAFEHDCSNQ